MTVDPVDDCTFWYTAQYYNTSSTSGWLTEIRFPFSELHEMNRWHT
jgi:hypothetical protein